MPSLIDTSYPTLSDVALDDLLVGVDASAGTVARILITAVLRRTYPIGCIYESTDSTDPATVFGFGTWESYGAGRVLVGIDPGDTDFDAVGETRGAKTHTLTSDEMPAHTHVQDAHTHVQDAHTHTQDAHTHVQDAHNHQIQRERSATTGAATTQIARTADTSSTVDTNVFTANATATNQNATATNQNATAVNQNATAVNQNTGGGSAHNNIQPSIVVYRFRRTA